MGSASRAMIINVIANFLFTRFSYYLDWLRLLIISTIIIVARAAMAR